MQFPAEHCRIGFDERGRYYAAVVKNLRGMRLPSDLGRCASQCMGSYLTARKGRLS